MKLKSPFLFRAVIAGFLLTAPMAGAQSYFTGGHGDIGIGYTPGESEFDVHWHVGAGAIVDGGSVPVGGAEYAPGELIAHPLLTTTAGDVIANALGVSTGSTVYRMGNNSYQPNLGFAAEEIGIDTLWGNDGYITVSLTSVSGPGEIAISASANSGVIFSSLGESYTDGGNEWEIFTGDHVHLHWFFTEAGAYDLTFTWQGTYLGSGGPIDVTGTGTFKVQVAAIPEPTTWVMLASGVIGLGFFRRWRRVEG